MKIGKLFHVFLFILALAAGAFGQAKTITEAEYRAASNSAYSQAANVARRVVYVFTKYNSGAVSEIVETVTETQPPDSSRQLTTRKKDNVVTKTETIRVKGTEYQRVNGGRWEKEDLTKGRFMIGDATDTDSKSEYRLEEVTEGGEKFKVITEQTRLNLQTRTTFFEQKIFVDGKGLIRKSMTKSMNDSRDNLVFDTVTTYEYNPKDLKKITAPIK
ncbi:MAG TPA: hypothetical protein VF599_20500 [Pyrinomonadaceae bacterium]|jgi:hypothetical protein